MRKTIGMYFASIASSKMEELTTKQLVTLEMEDLKSIIIPRTSFPVIAAGEAMYLVLWVETEPDELAVGRIMPLKRALNVATGDTFQIDAQIDISQSIHLYNKVKEIIPSQQDRLLLD